MSREKVLANVCNRLEYYLGLGHEEIFTETSRFLLFQPEQQVKAHHVLDGIKFPVTVQGLTENWRMIVRGLKKNKVHACRDNYTNKYHTHTRVSLINVSINISMINHSND